MAGDKINIRANSWWTNNNVPANSANTASPLTDIVNALITGVPGASGSKVLSGQLNSTVLSPSVTDLLNNRNANNYVTNKPKAYLNWILLDEQFNEVLTNDGRNSGFEQVGAENEFKTHTKSGIELSKNGYLYVYVSNESTDINAFFDNLQVTHVRGPLVEETHYYPFGLTMSGISSKAAGGIENKKKYNGIEFDNDLDINTYDANFRELDPQTGRWWQIDPKIENMEAWSPYASNYDNPITFSDLLGDDPIKGAGFWRNLGQGLIDGAKETGNFVRSLGTTQGWQNLGNSISDAGDRMNPLSASGIIKNAMAGQNVVEGVKNIPNMTRDEVGHAIGYGLEKTAEAVVLSKGAGAVTKALQGAKTQTVYRVFGGDAKAEGFSWTPKDPNSVSNFRDAAGLPSGGASGANNTGTSLIEGTVKNKNIINQRPALPLDGNKGGLPEYIINPKNVNIKKVSDVNPPF